MGIILITGGSGLIGRRLTKALLRDGHPVRWLSRSAGEEDDVQRFNWDIDHDTMDARVLAGVDHIVHLSGAGIADERWTTSRMKELHASRGGAARLLLKVAKENGFKPKSFISASGSAYYGAITSDRIFSEEDPAGNDTISRLTLDWEMATDEWAPLCRVVKLRTAMVLAREGGALPRLATPVRWGLGTALGDGKQWSPWVHVDDLVSIYLQAIADERMHGAYNVAAPEQSTNRELMRAIARALRRPFFLPNVPAFALKLALGALSDVVLKGSRLSNQRLVNAGFTFKRPQLAPALRELLQ